MSIPLTVAGIDPGNSGGIAVIRDGVVVETMKMPLTDEDGPVVRKRKGKATKVQMKVIDTVAVYELLVKWQVDRIYIERVAAMPGQGVTSMFTFGQAYGRLLAAAQIHCGEARDGLPRYVVKVSPRVWQKIMFEGISKETLDTKKASVEVAARLHPEAVLRDTRSRVDHHGISDAVCLAHYGYGIETANPR